MSTTGRSLCETCHIPYVSRLEAESDLGRTERQGPVGRPTPLRSNNADGRFHTESDNFRCLN